jgi:hypothetical protein
VIVWVLVRWVAMHPGARGEHLDYGVYLSFEQAVLDCALLLRDAKRWSEGSVITLVEARVVPA